MDQKEFIAYELAINITAILLLVSEILPEMGKKCKSLSSIVYAAMTQKCIFENESV